MYVLEYNVDDKVAIYTDYKNDKGYEGVARLIKKKSMGDSFYLDYERMYVDLPKHDNSLNKKYSATRIELNNLSLYLNKYTQSYNKIVRKFIMECIPLCNRKNESYNKLYLLVEDWKSKYKGKTAYINNILKVNTIYIVRYLMQKYTKDWTPTLFREERWLVEFTKQYHPETNEMMYCTPFRTYRKLKKLLCLCPIEKGKKKELIGYTTYNGRCTRDADEEPTQDDIDEIENQFDYDAMMRGE